MRIATVLFLKTAANSAQRKGESGRGNEFNRYLVAAKMMNDTYLNSATPSIPSEVKPLLYSTDRSNYQFLIINSQLSILN
jgi:hypothetical protein